MMDYSDIPFKDCQHGTEGELLLFSLDRVHREFAWKTGGLDSEQLQQLHPPSKMTLAWLVVHLIGVEANWTARAAGPSHKSYLDEIDWDTVMTQPGQLYPLWYETIGRTRQAWAAMIEDGGLDISLPWGGDDYTVNRRRALTDILEENLMHTGHASIIREAIDGLVGNGPPGH